MEKQIDHQFSLFPHQPPKVKVKISKEQIEEAKRLYQAGDFTASASKLRDLREELEKKYGV